MYAHVKRFACKKKKWTLFAEFTLFWINIDGEFWRDWLSIRGNGRAQLNAYCRLFDEKKRKRNL